MLLFVLSCVCAVVVFLLCGFDVFLLLLVCFYADVCDSLLCDVVCLFLLWV